MYIPRNDTADPYYYNYPQYPVYNGYWRIKICNGCGGRGWISPREDEVHVCPICHGIGTVWEWVPSYNYSW